MLLGQGKFFIWIKTNQFCKYSNYNLYNSFDNNDYCYNDKTGAYKFQKGD